MPQIAGNTMARRAILSALFLLAALASAAPPTLAAENGQAPPPGSNAGASDATAEILGAPRDSRGLYRNNNEHPEHGFRELFRWMREHRSATVDPVRFPIEPRAVDTLRQTSDEDLAATWIGHSTFLLQLEGYRILTDPHFTERASPVTFAGPERTTPPGVSIDDLPSIDVIIISHNHYDHLDKRSIRKLLKRLPEQPLVLVPAGLAATLKSWGAEQVIELDWWGSTSDDRFTFTAVPVQHFSARTPFDRNRTLWAGWVIEDSRGGRIFFAGDTGYSNDFREIRRRIGAMDLSLLPIGAYDPRWFMSPMHVDPEQSLQIHLDLKSRLSIGMHWGTFILTDEPMREPVERLAAERDRLKIPKESFVVLRHGQTVELGHLRP